MKAKWIQDAKKNASKIMMLGVLEIIAGVFLIAAPAVGGIAITLMVGIMFLIGGTLRLIGSFMAGSFGAGALTFVWGLRMAVCYMMSLPASWD